MHFSFAFALEIVVLVLVLLDKSIASVTEVLTMNSTPEGSWKYTLPVVNAGLPDLDLLHLEFASS